MADLTIIGIGNRLRGDDALGPLMIDALRAGADVDLELIDAGSDALGLIEYLEDRKQVVLVDACRMGAEPGTVRCFQPPEVRLVLRDDPLSLHGLGLAETLQLAASLQMLPEDLKIIGIEPDSIQFNRNLSPPAQRALKIGMEMIRKRLFSAEAIEQIEGTLLAGVLTT